MVHFRLHAGVLFFTVVVLFPLLCSGIHSIPSWEGNSGAVEVLNGYRFAKALEYRNGRDCPVLTSNGRLVSSCEPSLVHIAMTLDSDFWVSTAGRGKREVGGWVGWFWRKGKGESEWGGKVLGKREGGGWVGWFWGKGKGLYIFLDLIKPVRFGPV